MTLPRTIDDREHKKFEETGGGDVAVRTTSEDAKVVGALVTLEFYESQGMTLTQIEDTYNIDFVVTDNCSPVISDGKLVYTDR